MKLGQTASIILEDENGILKIEKRKSLTAKPSFKRNTSNTYLIRQTKLDQDIAEINERRIEQRIQRQDTICDIVFCICVILVCLLVIVYVFIILSYLRKKIVSEK